MFMIAGASPILSFDKEKRASIVDSISQPDTLKNIQSQGLTPLQVDTTKMDSLQLAIYKYNKAIDDSLAFDSINRQRKNGIDAPVKYQAADSLVYEAASGRAYLYGQSHVEYQDMDLQSDRIFMVMDSSPVAQRFG